jgi:hypothetical protein
MAGQANDEQVEATLFGKVHDGLHFMAGDHGTLQVNGVKRGSPLGLRGKLPEAGVLPLLFLVDLWSRWRQRLCLPTESTIHQRQSLLNMAENGRKRDRRYLRPLEAAAQNGKCSS